MIEKLFELKPEKYGMYNDLEILPYLLEKKRVKFIIYGAGNMGIWFVHWAEKVYGILPEFFVDKNPSCQEINGVKVISLQEFQTLKNEDYFVVVAMRCYEDTDVKTELVKLLKEKGAITIFNANRITKQYKMSWYSYIREHINEFNYTYNLLQDEISKDTFINYFKTYILGSRFEGKIYPEEYKYWGIDSEESRMFELTENEVLLNLGGCCGDTVFQYLKGNYPFKKIITVEGDETTAEYLKRSINLLEDSVREKIQIDCCFVGAGENSIDNKYADEKITIINMDIEGFELEVLQTGINVIKRDRPVLAICAYHKKEDLIELPKFVMDNFENYVITIRKYPSFYWNEFDGIQQINELVMYAIPVERYVQNCAYKNRTS